MSLSILTTRLNQKLGRLSLFIGFGILMLIAIGYALSGAPNNGGSEPSNAAPNITLETLDGQKVSLSQYKGQVVLINFWATWCPPCKKEIPALEAAYQAYKDQGFVVLGVDAGESRQTVETFASTAGITYPILLDEKDQWSGRFSGMGLPMSVIIDRNGQIAEKHLGELTPDELTSILQGYFAAP